jgi:hypothetical protein
MGGLVMATRVPMPGPLPRPPEEHEGFTVEVEIDSVSRDELSHETVKGVYDLRITSNGDLLLFKGDSYPHVGYTAGAWIKFRVVKYTLTEEE